jgi:hypothetical protein
LIDEVDETDMFATVDAGVHQVGSIDVEDHESCPTRGWVARSVVVWVFGGGM